MAIKITSTKNYNIDGVKCLIHSPPGIGKTVLCATAPSPIIISAEAGLLSLADKNIPVIEVKSMEEVDEAYTFLTEAEEAKHYQTICLDSITEIAEVMLIEYKKSCSDPRAAYGQLNDDMASLIRCFRDLKGKHVYFTAKQLRYTDESVGITRYLPGMPGKTLLNGLPFFFDEVFAMRIGQLEDGSTYRYLQTNPDINYEAKDRSSALQTIERPDLTHIFDTISGVHKNNNKQGEK